MIIDRYQKQIIIRAIVLGVLMIALICGYFLMNKQSDKISSHILEHRQALAQRNSLLESLKKLEGDYNIIKDEFPVLYTYLPSNDQLINFSSQLKEVAGKDEVDLGLNFTIENAATGSEPKSYGFTLSLTGTTDNLIKYFTDVAKLNYIFKIDQIEMNKSGDNAAAGIADKYTMSILGKVFIR